MIRELRKIDAPRVLELLKTQFPEEESLLGTRPEGFAKVVRRVFRWDARLLVGVARLFGRPIYRFFVVEEDDQLVATTLLSFPERAGYVSMVVVDPAYRRRGYAQALLEKARATVRASGRQFIALDVLAQNVPARTLYERMGYRLLRESSLVVRDSGPPPTVGPSTAVRPLRPSDARSLAEIARRGVPAEVQEVLPVRESALRPSRMVERMLESERAAWVVDHGGGPLAYLSATSTPATEAGHFSEPIVGEGASTDEVAALVGTGVRWCVAHGSPRIVAQVPASNLGGLAALEGGGFHDALAIRTLYRPVA
ncbi:MAG: GNAT family N-acetyltransferase [Thermoplasmata archaeon]